MNSSDSRPIATFVDEIKSHKEIFIVTALIGLLITSILSTINAFIIADESVASVSLKIAVICLLTFLSIIICVSFRRHTYRYVIRGYVTLDNDSMPVSIPEYDFGEETTKYLNSMLVESEEFRSSWKEYPIGTDNVKREGDEWIAQSGSANDFIIQAVELYVLEVLDSECDSLVYASTSEIKNARMIRFNELPSPLRENVFISTFGTNPYDREKFKDSIRTFSREDYNNGITSWSSDGQCIFHQLNMRLPEGVSLQCGEGRRIEISTPFCRLSFRVECHGTRSLFPTDFTTLYLSKSMFEVCPMIVDIMLEVEMFYLSAFLRTLSHGDLWVDRFLVKLKERVDFDEFAKRIGWSTVYTVHKIQNSWM